MPDTGKTKCAREPFPGRHALEELRTNREYDALEVQTAADVPCATGENPLWHPDEKKLYWTDIPAALLYRLDPVSGKHETFNTERPVGGFTLQADGALLLFRDRGNVARFHRGRITDIIIPSIPGMEATRFNDVIADPRGRVFAGAMSWGNSANGRLYRIDADGSPHPVSEGYGTPNGMGFSLNERAMYFTDSKARRIYRFEYDAATGNIGKRTIFTETSEKDAAAIGRSDGMTVDQEGFIWSARWDGRCIVRYNPHGRIVKHVPMPAGKISSLAFGGECLRDLYATSAGGDKRNANDARAGALFRLTPGVRGLPEHRSRIGIA